MFVEVRRIGPEDALAYRALRLEALERHPEAFGSSYEEEEPRPLELWQESLAAADVITLGAFLDGELAAIGTIVPAANAKSAHKASIYSVYTRSGKRGRGLCTRIMRELLAEGRRLNRTAFRLFVAEPNAAARRLYERLGFRAYGREPDATRVHGQSIGLILMALDDTPPADTPQSP
jgi:RimJ/RimL family protein N-acetyltransferase